MAYSDAVVVGGGFAGLACAAALAESGVKVTLLERRPRLGGRAYSFRDPKTGETVDNGQHIFMGCYRHTLRFLRRIGSDHLLHFPASLRVDYADALGRRDRLSVSTLLPPPLHFAAGVLGLRTVAWRDKAVLLRLGREMRRLANGSHARELDRMTVTQWLDALGQPKSLQERLFDPLAIAALNDLPGRASALGLAQVLEEIAFGETDGIRIGLPRVGLSELFAGQARRFIEKNGGRVLLNCRAKAFVEEKGRVAAVRTDTGEVFPGGAVVSAIPPWVLKSLERPSAIDGGWSSWEATPILGVNLWLEAPVIREPVVGLIGTEVHWVFNKTELWPAAGEGQYLSLVISGAREHVLKTPAELVAMARADMEKCFPAFKKDKITAWAVVKEPYATPSPVCGSDGWRPAHESPVPGFYYAGDWTQTGLPATIESAAASGHACAELILTE